MKNTLIVLSLGAGVQSTTVLLLSEKGMLPRIDHAIFSDTGWEPPDVYEHLEWLESEVSIPIHRVSNGNILNGVLAQISNKDDERWGSMPLYTRDANGNDGMVRRQCTKEYKITPIEKFIKYEILGLRPRQRISGFAVDQWFGISADEPQRMRTAPDKWRRFCYPLVGLPDDLLGKPWRRWDCTSWLTENYPNHPVPRSACIGCPFHSNDEWRRIKTHFPEQWMEAVEIDNKIRTIDGMNSEAFLHRTRVPLSEVDLSESTQIDLFGNECEGMCGV